MSTSPIERKAVAFATYTGDHTHAIGERMGPNTLNEHLWVVEAVYDKETNKTRLGFTYLPPREQVGPVER